MNAGSPAAFPGGPARRQTIGCGSWDRLAFQGEADGRPARSSTIPKPPFLLGFRAAAALLCLIHVAQSSARSRSSYACALLQAGEAGLAPANLVLVPHVHRDSADRYNAACSCKLTLRSRLGHSEIRDCSSEAAVPGTASVSKAKFVLERVALRERSSPYFIGTAKTLKGSVGPPVGWPNSFGN